MCKIKNFILIIGLAMLLSSTAYSKVCFLGGGNNQANCLGGLEVTFTNCPGFRLCEIPKNDDKLEVCSENGTDARYKPEDCCSNTELYTPCDPNEGLVCPKNSKCVGTNNGEDYVSCKKGECKCDPNYVTCDKSKGLIGVGKPCGGKYAKCECDTSLYHKCDSNATGSGGSCTDPSTGVKYFKQCTCPSTGNWTTNSSNCCKGHDLTCSSSDGSTSYRCYENDTAISLGCVCGTTKNTSNGCLTGCSDNDYAYKGAGKNMTCNNSVSFINGEEGICGNDCHCATGFYEYSDLCNQKGAGVCAALGYKDATCSGDWVGCPFNSNIKKCINTDCYTYQGFCTDQTATFCATLGYTDTSCSGDWIACPLNANAKKCLPSLENKTTGGDDKGETCSAGQVLVSGECKTIHENCGDIGLYTQEECNATGYICGLIETTIYTSASGTTKTCYTRMNDLCPLGYATSADSCLRTPDGLTCADGYTLAIEGNYYSGTKKCGKCQCSLILSGGNLSQGCPCTAAKPYYVNGVCSATCPGHSMGLECFMCSIAGDIVR